MHFCEKHITAQYSGNAGLWAATGWTLPVIRLGLGAPGSLTITWLPLLWAADPNTGRTFSARSSFLESFKQNVDAEQSLAFWMFTMMRTGRCRPVASKLAVGHRSACMPCIHNSGYIRSRLRQSGAIVLQYKNTNNSTKRDPIHKYHKATEYSHTGCTYIGWPMNDLFCSQVMLFTEWKKTGNCKYFAQKFLLEMNMEQTILLAAVSH